VRAVKRLHLDRFVCRESFAYFNFGEETRAVDEPPCLRHGPELREFEDYKALTLEANRRVFDVHYVEHEIRRI